MNHVGPGMPSTLSLYFAGKSAVNRPSFTRVPLANMWSMRSIMRVVWSSAKSLVNVSPSTW